MEVVELLAELEEIIEKGIEIPVIKKTFLDKDKLLDLINDISLAIPDEFREAKSVLEDRDKILSDARRQADAKIKEAEHKMVTLIDEHEITRKANEKAAEIIEKAQKEGKDILIGFNPKFLIDALRVIDDEIVTLYMVNPKAPCFIKDEKESYTYLILPVNFNNAAR